MAVFEFGPVFRLAPLAADDTLEGTARLTVAGGWFEPIIVGIAFLGAAALIFFRLDSILPRTYITPSVLAQF
jgi:hypothetical protein